MRCFVAYLLKTNRIHPETSKKAHYYRIGWWQNGKQQTAALGFVTPKEAARLLKIWEGQTAAGEDPQKLSETRSTRLLADSLDRLQVQLAARGLAKNTQEQARYCCEALLRVLKNPPITGITSALLDQYVLTRREEGVRNRTIRIEFGYLKRALQLAKKEKLLAELPDFPMLHTRDSRPPRFILPTQRQDLADVLPWKTRPVSAMAMYLLLSVGARKTELLSARWEQVHWEAGGHGAIRLAPIEAEGAVVGTTKTRKARMVPLSSVVREVFQRYWERQGRPTEGWVFPGSTGHLKDVRTALEGACARAGVTTLSPHGLRHSFSTAAAAGGISKRATQDVGGWVDPRTLEDAYTHSVPEGAVEAVEVLSVVSGNSVLLLNDVTQAKTSGRKRRSQNCETGPGRPVSCQSG